MEVRGGGGGGGGDIERMARTYMYIQRSTEIDSEAMRYDVLYNHVMYMYMYTYMYIAAQNVLCPLRTHAYNCSMSVARNMTKKTV